MFKAKIATTPTMLQMEATECGAASLGMILGYYKKFVPLEELRTECGISRDGSKAVNIIKAAENYGLVAKAYKKDLAEAAELKPPFIVFWQFKHFLVIEGFKKGFVYLNDPDIGPRKVTLAEFSDNYTGVALTFEPGSNFTPGGEHLTILGALNERLKGQHLPVIFLFLVGLALVIPGILVPVFSKIYIDYYLVATLRSWVKPVLIGLAITGATRAILSWLQNYYLVKFESKISVATSSQFFWHILRLPIDFFYQRSVGDVSNRISLNDAVAEIIARRFFRSFLNVVVIGFYLALMFYYNAILTFVGIFIALINFLTLRLIARLRKNRSYQLVTEQGKLFSTAYTGTKLAETLRASGRTEDFFGKITGAQTRLLNVTQKLQSSTMIYFLIPQLLNICNTAIILTLGGFEVMQGVLSIGTLIAFQSLMASFLAPVNELVETAGMIQELHGNMNQLNDVMKNKILPQFENSNADAALLEEKWPDSKLIGEVEIKNITFGYNKLSEPLIANFDLNILPGSRVAIVGASGSGKSTLAKLISGEKIV